MSEITYHTTDTVIVRLDKKIVGEIRRVNGGWAYFPKGCATSDKIYRTVVEVKGTLEGK